MKNYNSYLDRGRIAGAKEKLGVGAGMALLMIVMYSFYSYAFWIGGLFVSGEAINKVSGELYQFNDILAKH